MPIHCPVPIHPLSDDDFTSIDHIVMACCYASQNTLGRLCDERVYENDVAARLHASGIADVHTQTPVTLIHDGFVKAYRIDLLVNQMLYELKTAAAFVPDHEAQAIHYAALTATDRVKLLNFRSSRVEGRLLRTPFGRVDRRRFTIAQTRWRSLSDDCGALLNRINALLADWGAFLEARLYEEALVHFSGGEAYCNRRLPVVRDGLELGTHKMPCHAAEVGFVVTALTSDAAAYEMQLERLLGCLPLRGMHWFNLNHAELQVVTLRNGKGMKAGE